MKQITVDLPDPGKLSIFHARSETVWYHNYSGEFTFDSYNHSLHDERGNVWSADELRAMALAALAAAEFYEEESAL